MSGYRSFHRQVLGSFPIWKVSSCPILTNDNSTNHCGSWRIWTACGDGIVRGYLVVEKSLETQKNTLDAAACNVILTHTLYGQSQKRQNAENDDEIHCIGCSHVEVARNHIGEDDAAGSLVIVSSDLSGRIRIWVLSEGMDNGLPPLDVSSSNKPNRTFNDCVDSPEVVQEFCVENATGTCIKIMPPNVSGVGDVFLAVPCLDGTIAVVATGLSTPKATKDSIAAGVIVERWSNTKSSVALSGDFHPKRKDFAVGRQDGLVEVFGNRSHRLIQHESPVRSISYTPDGNLLVTSSDDGMICIWDISRSVPALVQHVTEAHGTWVLDVVPMFDSRRFISCGADQKLHVWGFSKMDQALHTFTSDDSVWAIDVLTTRNTSEFLQNQRQTWLITGSENGRLHIYTLES